MNDMEIIKPAAGQKNWANAINGNFIKLYNSYQSTISDLKQIQQDMAELDVLQIQQTHFIYLDGNPNADASAYIIPYTDITGADYWVNIPTTKKESFDPSRYISYSAWFVQTKGDYTVKYAGYSWNTGDLLIVHQQNVGGITTTIEQWKNIMGGYMKPTSHVMDRNGIMTTTYKKMPSFTTTSKVELNTPVLYWKPVRHDYSSLGNSLYFEAYIKTDNGDVRANTALDRSIPYPSISWAIVERQSFGAIGTEQILLVLNVFKENEDLRDVGVNIVFKNVEVNAGFEHGYTMYYFPYKLKQEGNSLFIYVNTEGGTGEEIEAQITITKDFTATLQELLQ